MFVYDCFRDLSGGPGTLILLITVGVHAITVVKRVIQPPTVLQLGERNRALFVGVLNIMQSNVLRYMLKDISAQLLTVSNMIRVLSSDIFFTGSSCIILSSSFELFYIWLFLHVKPVSYVSAYTYCLFLSFRIFWHFLS